MILDSHGDEPWLFLYMASEVLTITLNPAIDRIIRHDRGLPSVASWAGGKGVNVARALKALGVPVTAVAPAGGAAGRLLGEVLEEENIAHQLSPAKKETRTNVTMVCRNGAVRRRIDAGPALTRKEQEALVLLCTRAARSCAAVVLSGSLPLNFPLKVFKGLVLGLHRPGVLAAVDTRGPALEATLELGVDIIKPNREEAEAVLGFRLSSPDKIRKALRTFISYGIKKVLISLGSDGLAASDGKKELLVRLPAITTGHAVGCGDAALAGFLSAELRDRGFSACVVHAAACGHANAHGDVPGGITQKDVRYAYTLFQKRKILWL